MAAASRDRVIEALRSSALLGVLPDDALSTLARSARSRRWDDDQCIFRRSQEGAALYVVLSGRVKIVAPSPSGAEVILNVIEPGEVFGEMSLIDGAPRCADAFSLGATEVVVLDRRDFLPVLERHPEAAHEMMAILCERIRQTTAFVESAVLMAAPARILVRLRGLAEQFGIRKRDGSIRIEHGFSQQELGDIVGLTRVSVNKHLADWRRSGLIEYERGVLVIRDLDGLTARAFGKPEGEGMLRG